MCKKTHFVGLLAFVLALQPWAWSAFAQDMEDIESHFKKVSPAEEALLRETLSKPLNKDAPKVNLEIQVNEKRMAAKKLALHDAEEAILTALSQLQNAVRPWGVNREETAVLWRQSCGHRAHRHAHNRKSAPCMLNRPPNQLEMTIQSRPRARLTAIPWKNLFWWYVLTP